jgi:hypothetical protein
VAVADRDIRKTSADPPNAGQGHRRPLTLGTRHGFPENRAPSIPRSAASPRTPVPSARAVTGRADPESRG